jgi:hypothetical protein
VFWPSDHLLFHRAIQRIVLVSAMAPDFLMRTLRVVNGPFMGQAGC